MRIIDISMQIHEDMIVYPENPKDRKICNCQV